ncbi:MAG: rhomboid family intramembrane serine protease [Nitrospirales bacterium]|nr:rhomboid family intramembrane serine protease [Nitrospira sp.]MDR4500803.1 rhomboid family intramembrane serine protease [Nitrospirales bacterium]
MIPLKDDNPTEITPYLTVSFIIACSLVFLYQASLPAKSGELFVYQYGAIPAVVFGYTQLPPELIALPAYGTLISSMFLHGGLMHLIGNMLYLWIFGNNIEDVMGHGKFILFYLACGIIAALSHAIIDPESTTPMVGASGAISGVLGAYLLLYPRAHVLVLIPLGFFTQLMHIPAAIVLGLWFVLQLISGGMSIGHEGGGVAFFAHVGGFVAGMGLIGVFKHPHVRFFNPPHHYRSSWD